jgi:hypothetical protein
VKLRVKPIERGTNIIHFAHSVVVFALAQSGSAEVEAQYRESKAVESFHRVEDDFVVQGSAKQRVRMANHSCVRRVRSTSVEQRFQASRTTFKEQRAD